MQIMGKEVNPRNVTLVTEITTGRFKVYKDRDTFSFSVKEQHYSGEFWHHFVSASRQELEKERTVLSLAMRL